MENKNILIAGYGFVGKAFESLLKNKYNIIIHDPVLGYNAHVQQIDAVIVCVSTPPRPDGSCEMKNVYEVIETAPDVPILIKSTISLEGWDFLQETFPNKQITFSPEFLRAETALEDLRSSRYFYLGGGDTDFWDSVFKNVFDQYFSSIEDPRELILAKYFRNAFLATKVSFFNQVYDLCKATGIHYTSVQHFICADDRIGHSHTDITKERGYGGHCFPKDVNAILKTAERNNVDLSIIKESKNYNNKIRRD